MRKVTLSGYIEVPDAALDAVIEALPVHIELTRQEAGCIAFEVTRSTSNANRFDVYEEFVDEASFEHHQARIRASRWAEVTENVSRHYDIQRE